MTRTGERILIGVTIVALLVALVIPLTALAVDRLELNSGSSGKTESGFCGAKTGQDYHELERYRMR